MTMRAPGSYITVGKSVHLACCGAMVEWAARDARPEQGGKFGMASIQNQRLETTLQVSVLLPLIHLHHVAPSNG